MNGLIDIQITWREVLDIALVAFIYYRLLLFIKGTRAVPVLYGLVLVVVLFYASDELGLYTLNWFLANFLGSIFIVIIILFQSDIRKALAEMGAGRFWRSTPLPPADLDQIVDALRAMAATRTGALIVIENKVPLGDVIKRGTSLDAGIKSELLTTIFYDKSPLHDGAVLVKGNRIVAAGCILPLSPAQGLHARYGTRHRAAIGISEETDAVALVVSEERGEVSMVHQGKLVQYTDMNQLREHVQNVWQK
jgi:uncharacterized protein (TIGR00159 family)